MAKWTDTRRFGPGPYLLGFRRERQGDGFPFNLPAIETIERLRLDRPITLLAGDNGSGKSTLLEAIAAAIGFAEQGGELERLGERPAIPPQHPQRRAGTGPERYEAAQRLLAPAG